MGILQYHYCSFKQSNSIFVLDHCANSLRESFGEGNHPIHLFTIGIKPDEEWDFGRRFLNDELDLLKNLKRENPFKFSLFLLPKLKGNKVTVFWKAQ